MGEPRTFAFEHAQSHRRFLAAMTPHDYYSVVPYFIDPQQNISPWNMNHQQAHNDRFDYLGVPFPPNLYDNDLNDPGQLTWWLFVNHTAHLMVEDLILNMPWTYPSN